VGALKEASNNLMDLNSPSKKTRFVSIINKSAKSSPRTKALVEKETSSSFTPRILDRQKGRKDNSANIVRRIITAAVVEEMPQKPLHERSKDIGVSIKTLRKSIKDIESMHILKFVDTMKKSRKSFVLTQSVKEKIVIFYNEQSRNSPNSKEMILVDGQRTAVKFLEHPLSKLFKRFKSENPEIKISQSSFERMRPKNIKLRSFAKRQVRMFSSYLEDLQSASQGH
jgi:hypothetical protein